MLWKVKKSEENISTFSIHKAEVSYDYRYFFRPFLFRESCTCRECLLPVSWVLSFPLASAWNGRPASPFLVWGCRCGSRSLCLLKLCVWLLLPGSDDLFNTPLAALLRKRSSPLSKLARDERLAPAACLSSACLKTSDFLAHQGNSANAVFHRRLSPPSSSLGRRSPFSPDFTLGEDH